MIEKIKFIDSWIYIFILSISFFVAGLVVLILGISQDVSLIIAGVSLIGTSASIFIASVSTKKIETNERPYVQLKIDENRYEFVQIALTNVGTQTAILKNIALNEELDLHAGEKLHELIGKIVLQPQENISFIYAVQGTEDYKYKYKRYEGEIFYKNIHGKAYKNDVLIDFRAFGNTLTARTQAMKRDYAIGLMEKHAKKQLKETKKMNNQLKNILKERENNKQNHY